MLCCRNIPAPESPWLYQQRCISHIHVCDADGRKGRQLCFTVLMGPGWEELCHLGFASSRHTALYPSSHSSNEPQDLNLTASKAVKFSGAHGIFGGPLAPSALCFLGVFLWTSRAYLLPHIVSCHYLYTCIQTCIPVCIHMNLKILRAGAVSDFMSSVQRQMQDLAHNYWCRNICWRDAESCISLLSKKTPCSLKTGTTCSLPQRLVSTFQRSDNRYMVVALLVMA